MTNTASAFRFLAAVLGIACALASASVAQTPAPAPKPRTPVNSVALRGYWVPLRYANPEAVLKLMHWDHPGLQVGVLPAGVASVSARPGSAGLLVQATPAGYEQIRQTVKILDVPSGQVQLRIIFVTMPTAKVQVSDCLRPLDAVSADGLMAELRQAGAVIHSSVLVTGNNQPVSEGNAASPYSLTPSIVSDGVLLSLQPRDAGKDIQTPATGNLPRVGQPLPIQLTVPSGETVVYDLSGIKPGGTAGQTRLVFVTPTLLPTQGLESPVPAEAGRADPEHPWFLLPLQHVPAPYLIRQMRWQDTSVTNFHRPLGVERFLPALLGNALFVNATPEGYQEMRRLLALLDAPGYVFLPTLTYLVVSPKDAGLHFIDGPTAALEVLSDAMTAQAFDRLTQTGHAAVGVTMDDGLANPMQECLLPTCDVSNPRLHGDDTLSLDFTGRNWDGFPVTVAGIHRGDVLGVRLKDQPNVTLIQVNF